MCHTEKMSFEMCVWPTHLGATERILNTQQPEVEDTFSLPCEEKHHLLAKQIKQTNAIGLSTMEWLAGSIAVFGPCGDGPLSRVPGLRSPQSSHN